MAASSVVYIDGRPCRVSDNDDLRTVLVRENLVPEGDFYVSSTTTKGAVDVVTNPGTLDRAKHYYLHRLELSHLTVTSTDGRLQVTVPLAYSFYDSVIKNLVVQITGPFDLSLPTRGEIEDVVRQHIKPVNARAPTSVFAKSSYKVKYNEHKWRPGQVINFEVTKKDEHITTQAGSPRPGVNTFTLTTQVDSDNWILAKEVQYEDVHPLDGAHYLGRPPVVSALWTKDVKSGKAKYFFSKDGITYALVYGLEDHEYHVVHSTLPLNLTLNSLEVEQKADPALDAYMEAYSPRLEH